MNSLNLAQHRPPRDIGDALSLVRPGTLWLVLDFNRLGPRKVSAVVLLAIALLATACSGGARPTITDERLDTAAIAAADAAPDQGSNPIDESARDVEQPAVVPTPITLEPGVVENLSIRVIETYPHDANAFTQGLELLDGAFIESTGGSGVSDLRRVDLETGEVLQIVATPDSFFAEGATVVGDQLVQLTWTEFTAFYWDKATFELIKTETYAGEGWGLCYDGSRLVMSDGSSALVFRNPETFDEIGRVTVTLNGDEVVSINELECVNGMVWANIWQSDFIVRIDPSTGAVNGIVDATELNEPPAANSDALNGIAWDSQTDTFLLTGKFWPTMYRVQFEPESAN